MSAMVKIQQQPTKPVEPIRSKDVIFWVAVREALIMLVKAIESRHLPDTRKPFTRT